MLASSHAENQWATWARLALKRSGAALHAPCPQLPTSSSVIFQPLQSFQHRLTGHVGVTDVGAPHVCIGSQQMSSRWAQWWAWQMASNGQICSYWCHMGGVFGGIGLPSKNGKCCATSRPFKTWWFNQHPESDGPHDRWFMKFIQPKKSGSVSGFPQSLTVVIPDEMAGPNYMEVWHDHGNMGFWTHFWMQPTPLGISTVTIQEQENMKFSIVFLCNLEYIHYHWLYPDGKNGKAR